MITILIDSLNDLLIPNISSHCDPDDDATVSFGENIKPVSHYILRLLEQGPCGARRLCREIVSVLRYEYTTAGLKLFVHGVDTIYTICETPEEVQRRMRTQDLSAIRIQSAWRGWIGRLRARRVREDRERMLELQRIHAIIQIQKMMRGFIARRRYLAIIDALARQKALETQESASTERVKTPDIDVPLRLAHIVRINGTDVEITVSPDSDQLCLNGFQDCLVTTTDVVSHRSASTLIPSSSLSRIWNNFKRLPLKFDEAFVCIHHIKLNDLKQVDLIGKNDPYVMLSYGESWKIETSILEEGGADVEWKYSDLTEMPQFHIMANDLYDKSLHVEVYDANQYRSNVLIGDVKINLTPLRSLTSYDEEYVITREIKKKGKITGHVTLTCSLRRIQDKIPSECEEEVISKATIHSLSDLFVHTTMLNDFLSYLAEKHLDLFLSRANGIMVLRLVGI